MFAFYLTYTIYWTVVTVIAIDEIDNLTETIIWGVDDDG
jgi:hypothetical protein